MWTFILLGLAFIIEIVFQTWVFIFTRIQYKDVNITEDPVLSQRLEYIRVALTVTGPMRNIGIMVNLARWYIVIFTLQPAAESQAMQNVE